MMPTDQEFEDAFDELSRGRSRGPQVVVGSRRWLVAIGVPEAEIPAGPGPFMLTKGRVISQVKVED